MFKKKKKDIVRDRLLEEELIVSASDIATAIEKEEEPNQTIEPVEETNLDSNTEVIDEVVEAEVFEELAEDVDEAPTDSITEEQPQSVEWKDHVESIWDRVEADDQPQKVVNVEASDPSEEQLETAIKSHFVWANADDKKALKIIEQKAKAAKKANKKRKGKDVQEAVVEEEVGPIDAALLAPEIDESKVEEKVDLNSFFEASKQKNKKLKRRDRKQYSKKELKRRAKRKKKGKGIEQLKDQNIYKFRRKKYKSIEEFITYLNDHYLDIDFVARDVLADELFLGWLSKKSGVFNRSLKEFKDIKEKIEKNS